MGTKLIIGKESLDLPRGAVIPREGDILRIALKGKKEKLYSVTLIEHVLDFNTTKIPYSEITLKEVK